VIIRKRAFEDKRKHFVIRITHGRFCFSDNVVITWTFESLQFAKPDKTDSHFFEVRIVSVVILNQEWRFLNREHRESNRIWEICFKLSAYFLGQQKTRQGNINVCF
jgi:hypothetical protein